MEDYVTVLTTTEKKEEAERIARNLVGKKLAACVQITGPIQSTYWWEGKVETAQEWLCLVKSKKSLFVDIERAIKADHPYDTPEIIALPIIHGSKDYLAWVDREVS